MSAPATKIPGVKTQAAAIGGALLTPTRSMHSKSYSMSDLTPADDEPVNKENIGDAKNRKKRNSISSRKRLSIGIATQGGTKSYRELKENEEVLVAENTRLANELDDALESRHRFKTELDKANALVASYKKHVQEVEDDANAKITEVVTKSETEVKSLQKELAALKKRTAQMERKLKGLGVDVVSLQPIDKMAKDAEAHEARAQEFDGILERMRMKLDKRKKDAATAQATHRSLADRIKAAISSAVPLFGTVAEEETVNESVNEELSDSEFKDGADFIDDEESPSESPKFVAKAFVAPQEIDSRRMTNMSFEDIERVLMEEELEEELRAQQAGRSSLSGVVEESANDEENECDVNVLDAAMAQVREIAAQSTPSKTTSSPSPAKASSDDGLPLDDPNVSQAISEIGSLLENDAVVPDGDTSEKDPLPEMQQAILETTTIKRSFSAHAVTAEVEECGTATNIEKPTEETEFTTASPTNDVDEDSVDLLALQNAMNHVEVAAAATAGLSEEHNNEADNEIAALGAEAESTESVSRLLEISAALCEPDDVQATKSEDTADSPEGTPEEEDELVMGAARPRSPVMPTVLEDQTFRDDGTSAPMITGADESVVDESFLRIEQVVMSIGSEPEEEAHGEEQNKSAEIPPSPTKDGYTTAEEDGSPEEGAEQADKESRGRFENLQVEVNDSFRALLEADITPIDIQPPSDDSAFDCGAEDEDRFEDSVDHLPEHADSSPEHNARPDADSPASMTDSILQLERQLEEEIDLLNEDEMYDGEGNTSETADAPSVAEE